MYIQRLAETNLQKTQSAKKVLILVGARQVGKTTLVEHCFQKNKTVYLNFDIETDISRFKAAASLSPKDAILSLGNPEILIIDEAQRFLDTARIVKGWFDSKVDTQFVLLGSSSLHLLDQSVESLTGRNEKYFLTQLTFQEIITAQNWYSPLYSVENIAENFSEQIQSVLLQSMVFGSYPETILSDNKHKYLLNLSSDYLFKDILQIGIIKTPELLRKLLMMLAYQVGSEVSVNELSQKLGMSRVTVEKYLDLLESTFVIFRLQAFSSNPRKEIHKKGKYYFWDNGIRNAILNDFTVNPNRADIGKLWENWVISEVAKMNALNGMTKSLYFWRNRSGSEIDLIVRENDQIRGIEIKWSQNKFVSRAFEEAYGVKAELVNHTNFYVTLFL